MIKKIIKIIINVRENLIKFLKYLIFALKILIIIFFYLFIYYF